MSLLQIILISVALAMDAFAVSICKGLVMKKLNMKKALIIALWFGSFQAIMTVLGYYLGTSFEELIKRIDYWISFGLLSFVGINMIKEAFDENNIDSSTSFKTMFMLAVATSIDALTVGITFAFTQNSIFLSSIFIGCTTFLLSIIGVFFGSIFGYKHKRKAQLFGGAILIGIGVKIFIEHVFFY